MHSFPADISVFNSANAFAAITVRAERFVQHERHFRVTFWDLLSNTSALALGLFSALSFFLSYLNSYESERAMIQVLYQQESEPNNGSNPF